MSIIDDMNDMWTDGRGANRKVASRVGYTRFNAAPLIKLKKAPRQLAQRVTLILKQVADFFNLGGEGDEDA